MWVSIIHLLPFGLAVLATHHVSSTFLRSSAEKGPLVNSESVSRRRLVTVDPYQELTDEQRQAIIDKHNWWRDASASGSLAGGKKARSMPKIYWDAELEEHSKNYSRNCKWEHSQNTEYNNLPYGYGENNYAVSFAYMDTPNFERAIDAFGEEIDDPEWNYDVETGLPATHYGQVVWEASVRVGCGVTRCYDSNIIGLGYKGSLMVCQYYIQGNKYGTYGDGLIPYEYTTGSEATGVACSDGVYGGSTGMDSRWTSLCNNKNSICDEDDRCSGVTSCVPGGNLNGEYTSYTCEPGLCDFIEYPGHEINIAYPRDWAKSFCQDGLDACKRECYETRNDNEPCVGITTGEHLNLVGGDTWYWTVKAYDQEDYLDDETDGIYYELVCNTDAPTSLSTYAPTSTHTEAPTSNPTDAPTSTNTDAPISTHTDAPTSTKTDAPTSTNADAPTSTNADAPTSTNTDATTSTPTYAPTSSNLCIRYKFWSEEVAEENCPKSKWGSTIKGYRTAIACDSNLQDRLEESLANKLYSSCSAWCVYDFQDKAASGFIWRISGCWESIAGYTCYTGGNLAVKEAMADFVSSICPVQDPTDKAGGKSDAGTIAAVVIVLLLLVAGMIVLFCYFGFCILVRTPTGEATHGEEGSKWSWPIRLDWSVCFWNNTGYCSAEEGQQKPARGKWKL